MRITLGHLGNLVLTMIFVFCLLLIARESFAQEFDGSKNDGKVDVGYSAQLVSTSRQRRATSSLVFGLGVDNIFPEKFRSKINDASYKDAYDDQTIPLIQADLGWKINFPLGGISASLLYGRGSVSYRAVSPVDSTINILSDLTLTKIGGSATFVMDNLFEEPYVAPYISGQIFSLNWEENAEGVGSKSGSTAISSAIQIGALFQLNWLDREASLDAFNSSGLTNTYIDVFVSQYNASEGSDDPNFQTPINFGAGLRLEF